MDDNIEIVKNLYTTSAVALEDMRVYTKQDGTILHCQCHK